jgi:hypothetical protein
VKLAEWGPKETGGVADDEGTERNHKSEEEDLMPDKKGASEEAVVRDKLSKANYDYG